MDSRAGATTTRRSTTRRAPAHAKRTAQESFDPEAFVVRRSMPWADGPRAGFRFVSFGRSSPEPGRESRLQPKTCFITGIMRRTPATAVAQASPPIIAPLTPQDMMS